MTPAIVYFAPIHEQLTQRLSALLKAEIFNCGFGGQDVRRLLPRLYAEGRPIIGLCASGILIRLLAPLLVDKHAEPPVVAISADGRWVVPLLGGHHGANTLARQIADATGGAAAITTASDVSYSVALDEPPAGWALDDDTAVKPAVIALMAGAKLQVEGYAPWLAEAGYPVSSSGAIKVRVAEGGERREREILYRPRTLLVGVGAERGVEAAEVIALIDDCLKSQALSPKAIAALGTIDLKADEAALHEASKHYGVPLRLFSSFELNQERYRLLNPSDVVEAETGTPGVAEAAALKAGTLLVPKRKSARVTCAIGRAKEPIDPLTLGRAPGVLHVVGIGPGDRASRTGAAVAALTEATDWVGYELYLDLIGDLRFGQVEHRFALGEEEVRVRTALELAAKGRTVALVCSGDAQIYAMASLVFELIEATGARSLPDSARRVEVEVHPGVTALQAASAAAGALIGHDFCTISLSDLLTPAEDIRKRLEAAARADFVTALYNPRSAKRTSLIGEAKGIFLAHRPPETPVLVAANLGRENAAVELTTIANFDISRIDMLTVVLIGSSTSRAFRRGDGRTVAFTPRGYEKKAEA